jgi:hypothetical protein
VDDCVDRAVAERVRLIWSEGREAFASPEDSWALFLLIWMSCRFLFFSASQSKLPGYILPAVPAGRCWSPSIWPLAAAFKLSTQRALRSGGRGRESFSPLFAAAHGVLCGLLIFAAFSAASIAMNHHLPAGDAGTISLPPLPPWLRWALRGAALAPDLRLLSRVTLFAVVISVAAVIRFAAPVIDATQSARPIARAFRPFRASRSPSRFIISIACGIRAGVLSQSSGGTIR